jgi:hypothetical protein
VGPEVCVCVGRGVGKFRGFHPILEGFLWENTVRGANICPRPARERAQVSSTPCSSASVGAHLRRRCVCRTPDPTITLLWPSTIRGPAWPPFASMSELSIGAGVGPPSGPMVRAGGHRAGNRRTKDFQRPSLLSVSFLLALLPVLAAVVDDAAELSLAPPPPHPMVDIFVHGDGGFPCWRVPAVVMAKSTGRLFAFAEARNYSGDGCEPDGLKPNASHPNEGPRSLALKTSTNDGRSWSELRRLR